ncbi:hypothetical protein FHV99_004135, partial [Ochrobactrum sp. P20RRXII]|nr:hypothetical protein [Ochrobactrum sp. P20RRXII]
FDAFMELSFSQIRDHKWKIPVLNGLIYWEHVRFWSFVDRVANS